MESDPGTPTSQDLYDFFWGWGDGKVNDTTPGVTVDVDTAPESNVNVDTTPESNVDVDTTSGGTVDVDTTSGGNIDVDKTPGSDVNVDTTLGGIVDVDATPGDNLKIDPILQEILFGSPPVSQPILEDPILEKKQQEEEELLAIKQRAASRTKKKSVKEKEKELFQKQQKILTSQTKPKVGRRTPIGDSRLEPAGLRWKKSPYSKIGKPTLQDYTPIQSDGIKKKDQDRLKLVGLVAMICLGKELPSLLPASFHMRNSYYHSRWRSLHLSYSHIKCAVIIHELKGIITCFGRESHEDVIAALQKTVAVLNILGYKVEYSDPLYLNVIKSITIPHVLNTEGLGNDPVLKERGIVAARVDELGEFPGRNFYDPDNQILITVFEGRPETKRGKFKPARIIYKIRRGETIGSGRTRDDTESSKKYQGEDLSIIGISERIDKTNQKFLEVVSSDQYKRTYTAVVEQETSDEEDDE